MKNRTFLSKKLEIFYKDIEPKREKVSDEEKMRIQTDFQFQQNEIRLNEKCNTEMFSRNIRWKSICS